MLRARALALRSPEPIRREEILPKARSHDVAVGVARSVVPSLTRLRDYEIAIQLRGTADARGEQGVLRSLAPVLGEGPRETEVGDSMRRVERTRTGRLVAVDCEPAEPAGVRHTRQPLLDRLGKPVAQPHDAAERRRLIGPIDLDEPQRGLRRWRILKPTAEDHPAPARLEPSRAQPRG